MWLDTQAQANALLGWADAHWNDRKLPWRAAGEPFARQALVEGLLAQTRADAVAAAYDAIFGDVQVAGDWLVLSEEERFDRVAPLGLPTLKQRAVDGIARVLTQNPMLLDRFLDLLDRQPGIGPYTAGMVALLMGLPAAPVDTNVDRVGRRVAPDRAPGIWIGELVNAVIPQPPWEQRPAMGETPGYRLISMVLDVGATVCAAAQLPECERCPLNGRCWYSENGKIQRLLPL
jgi:adenine-specific DNA glycosylase